MNKYPLWKNLLIFTVLLVGVLYALPNLYGEDPALQIAGIRGARVTTSTHDTVTAALVRAQIPAKSFDLEDESLLVRFNNTDDQLRASEVVRTALGDDYTVAINLAPATPEWLSGLNAMPMYLGLDLRGGVHFLLEVDMRAAINQALERYAGDLRTLLREEKIRYLTVTSDEQRVEIKFRDEAERERARDIIQRQYRELATTDAVRDGTPYLYAAVTDAEMRNIQKFAIQQNTTTLRNRVNELGVTEPVIQQQGEDRIVVQLAGVQDTARAKDILGATATLEYHLVDEKADPAAALAGRVSPGSRLYRDRDGQPVVLLRDVIITGDQVIDAASGIDSQSGGPNVNVTLDGKGARRMSDVTRNNIGTRMAVVFIETKTEMRNIGGQLQRVSRKTEEVISVAVIRDHFSKRFQTTGLDSPEEARTLALLLRAGALAAPMQIVEERTVGPSLGQANIDRGFMASLIGFFAVTVFMVVYYRAFGMVANVALFVNVVLLLAALSILQATLTLPGIAGIALTMGMAVDANVLIFERIREELRAGNSIQASISAGYDRAAGTILDSNITTLLAAAVLFIFGTGPVKGFAVTLSLGILSSMFTSILLTRAIVNWWWGGRRLTQLPV